MSGWIKLYRQIENNDVLNDGQPFDKTHAWIDILLNADRLTGVWSPLSQRFLEVRWNWSRERVRRFLKKLIEAKMITLKTTPQGSEIHIKNYEKYQQKKKPTNETTLQPTNETTESRTVDSETALQQPTNETTLQPTNETKIQEDKEDKNINNIGRRSPKFVKPTIEQVREYCIERGNGINPESFIDFYEARGWKLSKGLSMKDWKAAVRTWERNNRSKTSKFNNHQQRDRNMSELEKILVGTN